MEAIHRRTFGYNAAFDNYRVTRQADERGRAKLEDHVMLLSKIFVYPIKSTAGVCLDSGEVGPRGLVYDRHWALVDDDNNVVTAREHPALLRLSAELEGSLLSVIEDGKLQVKIPLDVDAEASQVEIQVFDAAGTGVIASTEINDWFSGFLGAKCRLVFMSKQSSRSVIADVGGSPGDVVSFADSCPLMMLSEATLEELNGRLDRTIPMVQFRPNLVVTGCDESAEDSWQRIRIGECEFEMLGRVKRCVFATINPDSQVPDDQQEPLRTLSTYRQHEDGGVAFGRHLIARRFGKISCGDKVEIIH